MHLSPLHCIESQGMSLEHKQERTDYILHWIFCIVRHFNAHCTVIVVDIPSKENATKLYFPYFVKLQQCLVHYELL